MRESLKMAIVNEYHCDECGLELSDDGRLFYYDDKSQECIDYLLLMSTVQLADGSRIKGDVNEIYCKDCDMIMRVYTIREVDDIENPCDIVEQGIKNRISHYKNKVKELEKIKERETYTIEKDGDEYYIEFPEFEDCCYYGEDESEKDAIENAKMEFHIEIDEQIERLRNKINLRYLVIDQSDMPRDYYNQSEKVSCPECGKEINKYIIPGMPCPKCGNEYFFCFSTCYD